LHQFKRDSDMFRPALRRKNAIEIICRSRTQQKDLTLT
jgi:hypothetical protein